MRHRNNLKKTTIIISSPLPLVLMFFKFEKKTKKKENTWKIKKQNFKTEKKGNNINGKNMKGKNEKKKKEKVWTCPFAFLLFFFAFSICFFCFCFAFILLFAWKKNKITTKKQTKNKSKKQKKKQKKCKWTSPFFFPFFPLFVFPFSPFFFPFILLLCFLDFADLLFGFPIFLDFSRFFST